MKVSLCHLFNEILRAHKIPEDWRNGLIVPLFKDGDPELAANYRGITLLSNVGKIFGSIIEKKLSKCEENKIFEQEQAGFRPGKTTTHHLPFGRDDPETEEAAQTDLLLLPRH